MENCIDERLLNEFCTISTSTFNLIGQISKIYEDKFAVNILSNTEGSRLPLTEKVELRVETLNNEVFFYVALIESQHLLSKKNIVFLKPISSMNESNKRQSKRLKIDNYLKATKLLYRDYPPKDAEWHRVKLLDLSEGGIRFSSNHYLNSALLIEIKLGQPFVNELIEIVCRIVKITKELDEYIISVQYINLSEETRQKINSYVNTSLELIKTIHQK